MPELINENEAARRLGVSVSTIRTWRSTRVVNLPYIKFGRCVRYSPVAIEKFIAEQTVS